MLAEGGHEVQYHEISRICGARLVKIVWLIRRLQMDIQERTSVSCSGVNCQHVKLYDFNTVWESLIWFQRGISQIRAMRKIGAGTIMQEATINMGNLSSKWAPLKWDLILIKRICGLIHKFSCSINLFSTTFRLSSICVYMVPAYIYLLSPKL